MRAPAHIRRFRVTEAVAEGLAAVPRVWARCWAILAALGAISALNVVLADRGASGWLVADFISVGALMGGAVFVTALMAWGAANRVEIRGEHAVAGGLGFGGLQMGRVEVRLIAALLLNLLFLAMIAAVLALVALALFGAAGLDAEAVRARDWAAVGPPWKLAVLGVVGAIVLAVPVLLIVRLALFSQATVGRGQAVSLNTLGIATGSFWRLLALLVVVIAPLAGLSALAGRGTVPAVGMALTASWLWLPFAAGALSAAYRRLEYWKPGG